MNGGITVNTESLRNARTLDDSIDKPGDNRMAEDILCPGEQPGGTDGADTAEAVLGRYAAMVYRLAFARTGNRYDADDILQEVFLRYIRSKPAFAEEEHRKAWLIRTAINCSKSLLTSAWFRNTTPLDDTLLSEMKDHSEVYYAVLTLPVHYRTVVHLFYYEDYSVEDIARLLKSKPSTVKSQLHRARNLLREQLKGELAYV